MSVGHLEKTIREAVLEADSSLRVGGREGRIGEVDQNGGDVGNGRNIRPFLYNIGKE